MLLTYSPPFRRYWLDTTQDICFGKGEGGGRNWCSGQHDPGSRCSLDDTECMFSQQNLEQTVDISNTGMILAKHSPLKDLLS